MNVVASTTEAAMKKGNEVITRAAAVQCVTANGANQPSQLPVEVPGNFVLCFQKFMGVCLWISEGLEILCQTRNFRV